MGTPSELYTEPKNTFVAEFIGNPTMNLIEGKLEPIDGSQVTVTIFQNSLTFPVTRVADGVSTTNVMLGFRPEDVELHSNPDEGYFTGKISLIERIGDRMQATIDGPLENYVA